jgi:hypothetical protein
MARKWAKEPQEEDEEEEGRGGVMKWILHNFLLTYLWPTVRSSQVWTMLLYIVLESLATVRGTQLNHHNASFHYSNVVVVKQ